MIARHDPLLKQPQALRVLTGLTPRWFEDLAADMLPRIAEATRKRQDRPDRKRAPGAGRKPDLVPIDRLLLTIIWLRRYPTYEVLGWLFGVNKTIVCRTIAEILPLLEAAGQDTMRMPDPGKFRRRSWDELLHDTPEIAVIVDSFEQPVQRPQHREEADRWYSGKKKRHTVKTQVAVDEITGRIVDVCGDAVGPMADLTLLEASGLLPRLPTGVGALGDLAYVGMQRLHPTERAATPRRKPRGRPRPAEDIAYNRAFARRRVGVEHTIGRLRTYQALRDNDRHHRRHHQRRTRAVAGLVNRSLEATARN